MNPMQKPSEELLFKAASTHFLVYSPVQRFPVDDISARRRSPRESGVPTAERPDMIPGPGRR